MPTTPVAYEKGTREQELFLFPWQEEYLFVLFICNILLAAPLPMASERRTTLLKL